MKTKMVVDKIYKKKTIEVVNKKARMANMESSVSSFLMRRIVVCLVLYAVTSFIPMIGLLIAPFITILYYHMSERIFFDRNIAKRSIKIENELPLFIEVVITALENKLEFKKAIEIASTHVPGELANEFSRVLDENSLGKGLGKSFDNMIGVMPNQNAINFINLLNQASDMNVVIGLENQLKYLNDSKRNIARIISFKQILNVSLVTLIFFIPLILIIIYTPMIIELLS